MPGGQREEVLNVELARLLDQRGHISAPETIVGTAAGGRSLPDVIVTYRGLRVALEGKIDDNPAAEAEVSAQAQDRVDKGLSQIGIAVVYPSELRTVSFSALPSRLAAAHLRIRVATEAGIGDWMTLSDIDGLSEVLSRTFEQLVREDVVAQALELLEEGLGVMSQAITGVSSGPERVAGILGISRPSGEADESSN